MVKSVRPTVLGSAKLNVKGHPPPSPTPTTCHTNLREPESRVFLDLFTWKIVPENREKPGYIVKLLKKREIRK